MRILMIESSPHMHGSSNLLAERFMEGAKETSHQVVVFDAAQANLHPCLGCATPAAWRDPAGEASRE